MNHTLRSTTVVGLFLTFASLAYSAPTPVPATQPSLTDAEKADGWKLIFDGKTTTGWRGLGMDGFPKPQVWFIDNGCLHCLGGGKEANDLVTVDEYDNFEMYFEWLVPKLNGNSGVKYRVTEKKRQGYAFGCEYQCMNDPDAFDIHASGSLYDVLAPKGKKLAADGEFNVSRIILRGNHVEHWLNGVKVVESEFNGTEMNDAIAKSKFKKTDWGKKPLGHIILQDHHSEVIFRNLRIRVLPAPDAK